MLYTDYISIFITVQKSLYYFTIVFLCRAIFDRILHHKKGTELRMDAMESTVFDSNWRIPRYSQLCIDNIFVSPVGIKFCTVSYGGWFK